MSTTIIINCLAQDCTDGFKITETTWDASSCNNCSDIASDAPGSNSRTGSVTFVNAGGDDYHLAPSDTVALGYGVADPGSGLFSDDIDGQARGIIWDIGADEYVSAVWAGTVWGASNPTGYAPAVWSVWTHQADGSPAEIIGDQSWGWLNMSSGLGRVSPVVDTGSTRGRMFVVKKDVFGTGLDPDNSILLGIRGSDVVFGAQDALPEWEMYTAPVKRSWRYVQVSASRAM